MMAESLLGLEMERFLGAMQARGFAALTLVSYRQQLRRFVAWVEATTTITRLAEVRGETVQAYQAHLVTIEQRNGRPLSTATQLGRLTAVRSLFNWAVQAGVSLSNPATAVTLPRLVQRLPRTLTAAEGEQIVGGVAGESALAVRDRMMLELLWATGMRIRELSELTVHDVDLGSGEVCIRRGKGGKPRLVPLTRTARAAVERYLTVRRAQPCQGQAPTTRLLVTRRGRAVDAHYLTRRVRQLAARAGVRGRVTPHTWRHSVATQLLKAGADLRAIQQLLGHQWLATTQKYTRLNVEDLKRVVERCHPREQERDGGQGDDDPR
jgi:integrase/recombinase XerD